MNLLLFLVASYFVQAAELNLACEREHGAVLDYIAKANKEEDFKKDYLGVQVMFVQMIGKCIEECKKTPNDKVAQIKLKSCQNELPADAKSVVNTIKRKEEETGGTTFKNPAASSGGLDFKKVGGEESKGGVIQYKIPINPNPLAAPAPAAAR